MLIKTKDELKPFIEQGEYDEIMKYKHDLLESAKSVYSEYTSLNGAVELLKKYEITYDDFAYSKKINDIIKEYIRLSAHQKGFDECMEERKKHCCHTFRYAGHDCNYDYYKCTKCGVEIKS